METCLIVMVPSIYGKLAIVMKITQFSAFRGVH